MTLKYEQNVGPYKRTQTAALRQAKFFLPQQAAVEKVAAAVDEPQ